MYEDIIEECKTAEPADLRQWHANAYKTRVQSLGHKKTDRNIQLMNIYEDAMRERGILFSDLPSGGIFNGKGSS